MKTPTDEISTLLNHRPPIPTHQDCNFRLKMWDRNHCAKNQGPKSFLLNVYLPQRHIHRVRRRLVEGLELGVAQIRVTNKTPNSPRTNNSILINECQRRCKAYGIDANREDANRQADYAPANRRQNWNDWWKNGKGGKNDPYKGDEGRKTYVYGTYNPQGDSTGKYKHFENDKNGDKNKGDWKDWKYKSMADLKNDLQNKTADRVYNRNFTTRSWTWDNYRCSKDTKDMHATGGKAKWKVECSIVPISSGQFHVGIKYGKKGSKKLRTTDNRLTTVKAEERTY